MDEGADHTIARGLLLLKEGQFFAAHECFEGGWRVAEGEARTLLHALAQLAAGHHQLSLGRARAALSTWKKASAKLARVGRLDPAFELALQTFAQRLGSALDAPRLIDLALLPPPETWPFPAYLVSGGSSPDDCKGD